MKICRDFQSVFIYLYGLTRFPVPNIPKLQWDLFPLDLFISSDLSICSIVPFPPLRNSDHVVVSISIDFSFLIERDVPFHDYSRAECDGLRIQLREVPSFLQIIYFKELCNLISQ